MNLRWNAVAAGCWLLVGCGGNSSSLIQVDGGIAQRDAEAVTPLPTIVGIETIVEAETIAAGSPVIVHCSLIDEDGAAVSDATVETDVVFSPETAFAITGENAFATVAGPASAACRVSSLGLIDSSPAEFTIIPGPARSVMTTLDDDVIDAGGSTRVHCAGVDAYGNAVKDAAYRVETSPSGNGIAVADSEVTAEVAGSIEVACRVEGDAMIESAILRVHPGLPVALAMSRSPDAPAYRLGSTVTFAAVATDRYGNEVSDAAFRFSRNPIDGTQVLGEGSFRFDTSGTFAVGARITSPTYEGQPVFGSMTVVVGGTGPIVSCDLPLNGASVDHLPGTHLTVLGTASGPNRISRVLVDGVEVSVDPATGGFSTSLVPDFGMNFVELMAEDEYGQMNSTLCSFLVADEWVPPTAYLEDGVALGLHRDAIDDHGGRSELDSLGDILDAAVNSDGVIEAVDRGLRDSPTFLPDECQIGGSPFCLLYASIFYSPPGDSLGLSVGGASVDVEPVLGGLRVRANLRNINLRVGARAEVPVIVDSIVTTTQGWVTVDNFDLDVTFDVAEAGGTPDVALRSVNYVGVNGFRFGHFTNFFGSIVDLVDYIDFMGAITDAISGVMGDLLEDLLADTLTNDVGAALDGLMSELELSSLATSFDVPRLDGTSSVELGFNTEFSSIGFNPERGLFGFGTRFQTLTRYFRPNRGIPLQNESVLFDPPTSEYATAAATVNTALLSQVLYTLWRGGYFDVDVDPALLASADAPEDLSVHLEVSMPPVVSLVPFGRASSQLRVQVGGARVSVRHPPLIAEPMDVEVGATLLIDYSLGGPVLTTHYLNLGAIAVEELHMEVPSAPLSAEQRASLEELVQDLLAEALSSAISDGLPAVPIPTFTIPESAARFDLPVGCELGIASPILQWSGTEHLYLRGNFARLEPVFIPIVF